MIPLIFPPYGSVCRQPLPVLDTFPPYFHHLLSLTSSFDPISPTTLSLHHILMSDLVDYSLLVHIHMYHLLSRPGVYDLITMGGSGRQNPHSTTARTTIKSNVGRGVSRRAHSAKPSALIYSHRGQPRSSRPPADPQYLSPRHAYNVRTTPPSAQSPPSNQHPYVYDLPSGILFMCRRCFQYTTCTNRICMYHLLPLPGFCGITTM
jgi:hypothetical protein